MKIALVHDYLTQRGGAERVFELLCNHFSNADVFTSLYDPKQSIDLGKRLVQTTGLQNIPGATKHFRLLAPLYFPAFRSLDLRNYDLIISSSTSFAKAVQKSPKATHICLCHNVTRFLWDTDVYLQEYSDYKKFRFLIERVLCYMRKMDKEYAQEPDIYVANSKVVAQRIKEVYYKQAIVVNYPICSGNFSFSNQKSDFYLVASRLLSYKRIDVTIQAFNDLGLPLIIIGDGPERKVLESQAFSNIKFLGHVSDQERKELMAQAQAVIVTALEDYGLVPIEANASGTPVIAYGAGGILDTQIPGQTGIFFERQTSESIEAALLTVSAISWDYAKIRNHALKHFSEEVFFSRVEKIIEKLCSKKSESLQSAGVIS